MISPKLTTGFDIRWDSETPILSVPRNRLRTAAARTNGYGSADLWVCAVFSEMGFGTAGRQRAAISRLPGRGNGKMRHPLGEASRRPSRFFCPAQTPAPLSDKPTGAGLAWSGRRADHSACVRGRRAPEVGVRQRLVCARGRSAPGELGCASVGVRECWGARGELGAPPARSAPGVLGCAAVGL